MPLWGKTDELDSAPKWLSNTEIQDVYLVDETEAQVEVNRAKGIDTPGWITYKTYVDGEGNTRHKMETLVAFSVSAADAGDDGVTGNTVNEDLVVADSDPVANTGP